MNDIDELLRETGAAWRPAGPAIDLDAALTRNARRRQRVVAATTALALIVGGGVLWSAVRDRPTTALPATPTSPTTPTTGPSTSPSAPPSSAQGVPQETVDALAQLARSDAGRLAVEGTPVTAEAVRTTRSALASVLDWSESGTDSGPDVWLVQVRGFFYCASCSRPFNAEAPAGSVVQRVVDAKTLAAEGFSLTRQPADLAALGTPVALPLGTVDTIALPVPDPDEAALGDITRRLLVGITKDEFSLMGSGVATTLGDATQALFGHTPYPPSKEKVWFIQLQGSFTCADCTPVDDLEGDQGSVLTFVVGRDSGAVELRTLGTQTTDAFDDDEHVQLGGRLLSTAPEMQPAFASYPSASFGTGDGALLEGRLVSVGGCLAVAPDHGPLTLPILPTPASAWSAQDHTLTVGSTAVRAGDHVQWGGGFSDEPPADATVPDACQGLALAFFRVDGT
ncbi:MAG: hypothetical protein QM713_09405 [Arachnia sp.]